MVHDSSPCSEPGDIKLIRQRSLQIVLSRLIPQLNLSSLEDDYLLLNCYIETTEGKESKAFILLGTTMPFKGLAIYKHM